jgi:CubicO group peptidase (beta-lactamase class C family)
MSAMTAKSLLSATLALLTVFTGALPCVAQTPFEDGLKSHLGKLTKDELPGLAVLVARDGKIVFQGGFGFADLEKKTPVTGETKFRIGSVSKQFTAAAILRLADEGKLTLTDPLEKFFPGFPRGGDITVHQLLTHTSGLHSYTNKPEFLSRVAMPIAPVDLIAWFRDDKPDFAPGAGFLYNNSAYFLAGEIVAKVSGKSLDAFLREAFFEPLGMKDTGIFVNATPPPGIALGYSVAIGKATPALDWDMSWAGGAGALYSTVGDLFRWNEALYGGKIMKPDSLKTMTTPAKLPPGVDGMSYGYGLMMATINRLPSMSHGGGLNGWSSDLVWLPEQRCTVVALANSLPPVGGREPASVTRNIVSKFLAAEIAKVPPPKEDVTVDKKTYPDFVGRYTYQGAVLTVTTEDGRLYAQLTGQPKFEIFPSAADEFFWKVTDAQVKFQRNEKREVTAARHTQGGNTFTAPRIPESAVKLTVAELDAILGKYQYGLSGVMTVTRDGDTVFAQLTGQPKFQIFPKSATEFEWKVVPASVKFSKESDGKVTKATHTQNGVTFGAPKIE